MSLLEYWSCSNGHIVLRQYMPQSGTTCNVVGCEGERRKHLANVSDQAKTADEFVSVVWNTVGDEQFSMNWFHLMAQAEKEIEKEIREEL